jgi:hypothetical protein
MKKFTSTIINAIKTWTSGKIKNSTADWNQNDPNADNYVKNRTHWEEYDNVFYIDEHAIITSQPASEGWYYSHTKITPAKIPQIGTKYIVVFDGIEYEEVARDVEGGICFGKELPYSLDGPDRPYGIFIHINSHKIAFSAFTNEKHTFKVYRYEEVVHTIDSKYLGLTDDLQDIRNMINNKMDIENPVGFGSFSMNRKASSDIGEFSSAEGFDTTAAGNYSKAEGYMTEVNSAHTHVQGKYNIDPDGRYSIIEECDCTLGPLQSTIYYYYSSSYTFSAGYFKLVNGTSVRFSGLNNLPRGVYIAGSSYNTTSLYMLTDESVKSTSSSSTTYTHVTKLSSVPTYDRLGHYAHIVGNGTSEEERSNAHTLDWEGNAWYAGDVYVGSDSGTSKDEGSKKLATEDFVHETIQSPAGLLLTDAITGAKYRVQIQNGCLTSRMDIEASLIDFTYENKADGTYTITDWKGTLNGKPSTEIYIPNVPGIKL